MELSIQKNVDLSACNTLAIPAIAKQFFDIVDEQTLIQFKEFVKDNHPDLRVLGGGSNLVLNDHQDALVVKVSHTGRKLIKENPDSVLIKAEAGEMWHEFVQWTLEQGYYGLENLALIPGTVGASPVQNIGAYGVEVCQYVEQVNAIDLLNGESVSFDNIECLFSYRDSYFKKHEHRFLITDVVFKLSRHFKPILAYGPLQSLQTQTNLSAMDVFHHVIQVRSSKLPDPSEIPNAGSFFQNPIVSESEFEALVSKHPNLVSFRAQYGVKLAAGWLIEEAGLKGQSNEWGVGSYEKQALVLVNPGKADAKAVLSWASHVQQTVREKFGVVLEIEPRHWQ